MIGDEGVVQDDDSLISQVFIGHYVVSEFSKTSVWLVARVKCPPAELYATVCEERNDAFGVKSVVQSIGSYVIVNHLSKSCGNT